MGIRVMHLHKIFVKNGRTAVLNLLQHQIRLINFGQHFQIAFPGFFSTVMFKNALTNCNSSFVVLAHHLSWVFKSNIGVFIV